MIVSDRAVRPWSTIRTCWNDGVVGPTVFAAERNQDRYPAEFAFALTREDISTISQTVTSLAHLKFYKSVQAFTEHPTMRQGPTRSFSWRNPAIFETNRPWQVSRMAYMKHCSMRS
jgi:hypothetical protein